MFGPSDATKKKIEKKTHDPSTPWKPLHWLWQLSFGLRSIFFLLHSFVAVLLFGSHEPKFIAFGEQ